MISKRHVNIVVISDVHLGTFGCHAKELLTYLNSISPKTLILNGDIIDVWQFSKRYFPASHLRVIKKVISMATRGVEVYYITGNHDDMLRKFSNVTLGNIHIVDRLVLDIDGKKSWFFHGDIFDVSIKNARWLAKLGGYGYDFLILFNRFVNWVLIKMGRERISISKRVKNKVKGAIKFINNFEKTATDLAIANKFDYVVCGHIHIPKIETVTTKRGQTTYLNSGDWVENFTALEYRFKRWKLYQYELDKLAPFFADENIKEMDKHNLIAAFTSFTNKPNAKKD